MEQVYFSIQSYKALTEENLDKWLPAYEIDLKLQKSHLIAGNIPLVGFHDFLSVLITGTCTSKTSSNDQHLLPSPNTL
jgi:hypothetical protein